MNLAVSNIFLVLISLISVSVISFSQTPEYAGLKFQSKNVELYERTSAALFKDNPVTIKNKISISFDISFWTLKYFGTIWRIDNNKKEFSRLVFNQFKDPEYFYFQLFIDQQTEPLEISLLHEKLKRNSWIRMHLDINLASDSIIFSIKNISSVSKSVKVPDEFKSTIYFGLKKLNDINDYDLPGFYLKNLTVTIDDVENYKWDLIPSADDMVYDKVSNSKMIVSNGSWLIKDHYEWQLVNSIQCSGSPLFAYDFVNSRVFIDLKDKMIIYDLLEQRDTLLSYNKIRPGQYSDIIYNHLTDQIYSTFVGGGQISVFDFSKLLWTSIDTTIEVNGHFYGSVRFINPLDSALYMFGGYGWHTAKNKFFRYDFSSKDWKEVAVDGRISPRYNTAVSQFNESGKFLLFSGNGNEDGNQEKGFKEYFDLYLLDLNKKILNQYWSDHGEMEQYKGISNYPYIFFIPGDSSFYFLRSYSVNENMYWNLYHTQINKKNIIRVGADIFVDKYNKNKNHFFGFMSQTNEFFYLKHNPDFTKIDLYTLRYPPIKSSVYTISKYDKNKSFYTLITYVIIGFSFIILSVYLIWKRKKNRASAGIELFKHQPGQKKKNFIQLFGEVRLFDASGSDMFNSFSPKLKEIFLLILIRSINSYNSGITSDELSVTIWPEASPESAKSNRGVAINKIRKAISSVHGIELEFNNKLWVVKIEGEAKCDYLEYLKIRSILKNDYNANNELFANCLSLLGEGEFLKGISYEWLDSFKLAVNNEIVGLLKEFLNSKSEQFSNNVNLRLRVCDVVLKFDSVDEDAFKLKIRTHYETGNHQLAKNTYKLFVAEYKHLYDEEYPLTFQDILFSK